MTTDDLTAVYEKINQTKTCYDKLREEINSKLNECSQCLDTIEKLHCEVRKITGNLEEQMTNALNDEKEWEDIKVKLATISTKGMIILNVGGVKYTTGADTLTREKNTFFTALLSSQWKIERDEKDKSIFIDRNGKLFTHVLEYMRTGLVPKSVMNSASLQQSVLIEAEYFRLHSLIDTLLRNCFLHSTLLEPVHVRTLNEFYGKEYQRWELLYKASRDGFDASTFHTRCNNKGPTITIIRSNNNYLFGAYTSAPWTSDGNYKNDTTAFLFTLTNPHNIPPTKYLVNPASGTNIVYHNSGYGPTFGAGHDLYLPNNSNSSNASVGFPSSYTDTTGKGNTTFTGNTSFTVTEIEVFKLAF